MGKLKSICRLCQMPMDPGPFTMCRHCLEDSERVRHFMMKHPYVTVNQIVAETSVSVEKVEKIVELGWNKKDDLQKS